MLALAVILLAAGVASIAFGLFWTSENSGADSMMGIALGPTPIFIWGLVAAGCILLGLRLLHFGTRQKLRQRREHRRLHGMAAKISAMQAERNGRKAGGQR